MKFNVTFIVLCLFASSLNAKVSVNQFTLHGLGQFTQAQQRNLTEWVTVGVNATRQTLGIYPTPLAIYLHPRRSNEPVPWAHTVRDHPQSVHLYVDARFPAKKFIADWTIYHELAHMALPYLGTKYAWFSEGFASYMQYQIMVNAGLKNQSTEAIYKQRITPHLRWFNSNFTADQVARRLMNNNQLPEAYWGSAYFFVLADKKLQQTDQTLTSVIRQYQDCCRENEKDLDTLIQALDKISNTQIFSELLSNYRSLAAKKIYPRDGILPAK